MVEKERKAAKKIMNDLMRSEYAPPLTDAQVDAIISKPVKVSRKEMERARARFAQKLLMERHQEPVRQVERRWTFSKWIAEARKSTRLTIEQVADALGKKTWFVKDIESDTTSPWDLNAGDLASLVSLFRIHFEGVSQLFTNTLRSNRRTQSIGPSLTMGDVSFGDTSYNEADEAKRRLTELRSELERRQATELLR